jgi:hypothetical protein
VSAIGGSLPQTLQDLTTLIDFLRAKGVLSYSAGGISLSLLPDEPPPPAKPEEPRQVEPPKLGSDGLTAEQQVELYGRAFSDTKE